MIPINKEESAALRERFPNLYVVRTMKQCSDRHRYYMEEQPSAVRFLRIMRGEPVKNNKKGGERHSDRKKTR